MSNTDTYKRLTAKIDISVLNKYYANNMLALKAITWQILKQCNDDINQADYDDFYSLANYVLYISYLTYNPDEPRQATFDTFFKSNLKKRIKSEIRNRHALVREQRIYADSLDRMIFNDSDIETLADTIASDYDIENTVINRIMADNYHVDIHYLQIGTKQKNILHLVVEGYNHKEIKQMLNLNGNDQHDFYKRDFKHRYNADECITINGSIIKNQVRCR